MKVNIVDRIADRVRQGYLLAFAVLLGSYILSYYTTQQLLKQANWLNHTNNIIINLHVLQSIVKEEESALSGYFIVKDENFLDIYKSNQPVIDSIFRELKSLISDNPSQLKRLDTLDHLINQRYRLMSAGLAVFKQNKYGVTDSVQGLVYKGKSVMSDIHYLTLRMQNAEKQLLANRSGKLSSFSDIMKIINIASIIAAILLTFYSIITFTKENRAKKQADINAKAFREQLEMRVDELAEVNKELLELKSMEKFAATGRISRAIAHEVRNPLTNINLAAEHLSTEITSTPETELLLGMITRNSNRINQLVSDLLNTTKLTQLDFAKVSLNEVIDQSLQFAQDRLALKGIKVVKEYTPDLCDVLADAEKLKIAFLNIIVNAVEAMESDKGILHISTFHKDEHCVAVITDNGKGMNKEYLSKLFEPYFTTKENGNGLGLAHTQNIIISHKASISADSEVGKGSSFTVTLNYE